MEKHSEKEKGDYNFMFKFVTLKIQRPASHKGCAWYLKFDIHSSSKCEIGLLYKVIYGLNFKSISQFVPNLGGEKLKSMLL